MAHSDLLIKLIEYGAVGDRDSFRRVAEALISDERSKKHHVLADRLNAYLKRAQPSTPGNGNGANGFETADQRKLRSLVQEVWPRRRLEDLVLSRQVREDIEEVLEEHRRAEVLRSHGLEPRHRLLFVGPPGNGKTTLAEAMAEALALPLYVIQYDGLVGSFLGETSSRLRTLFDFVRTQPSVVFFDEFETIGKERGDEHEVGEIKRVVSTLLMQIDSLPSRTIVIVASNHPELLDRAVWRRFQLRIELPQPGPVAVRAWLDAFAEQRGFTWPKKTETLARRLQGLNFSEIEEFANNVYRRYILRLPDGRPADIVRKCLDQLDRRAQPRRLDSGGDTGNGKRSEPDSDFSGKKQ